MADNTTLNTMTGGDVIAADDIGPGVKYQRLKITLGADGVNDGDVASGNPMPVVATATNLDIRDLTSVSDSVAAVQATPTSLKVQIFGDDTTSAINTDATGDLQVDVLTMPSVTVTATNLDIRDLTSASDSVAVLQATGTNLHTVVDSGTITTVSTVTTLTGGGIAHDSADSGNPLKIGGRADTTFQAAAADGDRVDALFDVYGLLFTRQDHANRWSYHENSSSALTDTSVNGAPGVGVSIYITDIVFSTGTATACSIFFEEGASTILGPYYLEAVAGRGLCIHFNQPHKCTANTALTVTTSAAIAHGLDVKGFIAP